VTFLLAILKACAIVAVFVGAAALQIEIENRRCRRCDACRLDRQPGRLFFPLAHKCSKRRAEVGRVTLPPPKPIVRVGARRVVPEFTRQDRNVIPWKARA